MVTGSKSFETCDLVIEAVLENLDVKHAVLIQMEEILPENAISCYQHIRP